MSDATTVTTGGVFWSPHTYQAQEIDEVIEEYDGDGKLVKRVIKYKKVAHSAPVFPTQIWYGDPYPRPPYTITCTANGTTLKNTTAGNT